MGAVLFDMQRDPERAGMLLFAHTETLLILGQRGSSLSTNFERSSGLDRAGPAEGEEKWRLQSLRA